MSLCQPDAERDSDAAFAKAKRAGISGPGGGRSPAWIASAAAERKTPRRPRADAEAAATLSRESSESCLNGYSVKPVGQGAEFRSQNSEFRSQKKSPSPPPLPQGRGRNRRTAFSESPQVTLIKRIFGVAGVCPASAAREENNKRVSRE